MTQKFAYKEDKGEVTIFRCYSATERAQIPEEIGGCPVTKVAPYCFSAHMDEKSLEDVLFTKEETLPVLCGDDLEEVILPKSVTRVGSYCFYDCKQLRRISFTDSLKDWERGAFTRCHKVTELEIFIYGDGRSTLKEVLMELPELVTVDYHMKKDGSWQMGRLVFPEFYEEGIENTPARLINFEIHGSGMYYRNCFRERILQFGEYDSRFNFAGFQESFAIVTELALNRLRYPLELSEPAKETYRNYLKRDAEQMVSYIIGRKDMRLLIWFVEEVEKLMKNEGDRWITVLRSLTEESSLTGFSEGLSFLMDRQHRVGNKKKKPDFEL